MSLFRRRRRADVGTFEAPPRRPVVSDAHLVDESRMIAHSAVRMALKNRIIVDVLRDRVDFDPDRVAGIARDQLEDLAEQETLTAERLRERREQRTGAAQELFEEDERRDPLREEKARRGSIVQQLARSLDADVADDEVVAELVERARQDAWDEIQSSVRRRAEVVAPYEPDTRYAAQRDERVATLVALDLAGLAAEHGFALEGPG